MRRPGTGRGLPGHTTEREVDAELRFHLEEAVEALVARGASEEEARRRALEEFRELDRIRAECAAIDDDRRRREGRREMLSSIWRDSVLALRRLRRTPGFAAAALVTLALGIGATVAMYAVVEGVILRPLPYPGSERVVRVWPGMNFNIALADRFRELPALESVTGASGWSFILEGEGGAERIEGSAVDPQFFSVLGVRPALGRGFLPEERYHDRSGVVVVSHGLWQRRWGGDPGLVGRTIALSGHRNDAHTVVGIMPPGFRPLVEGAELWVPLSTRPGMTVASDSSWYVNQVVARLAPGATLAQAHAQVAELARRLREEFPGRIRGDRVRGAGAVSLLDATVGQVRPALWILLGAVGLVLVVACANVANLVLAEGSRRSREVAIRAALGASRGRLLRQSLVESLVLALLGGGLGVLFAGLSLGGLDSGLSLALPRTGGLGLDPSVVAFALVLSAVTAVAFGLAPALGLVAGRLGDALSRGGRRGTSGNGRLGRWLVAVETALSVVLVVGAGLLIRSFWGLYTTDPGFRPDGVLVVEAAAPGAEDTANRAGLQEYYRLALERLRSLPGVSAAGAIHLLPLTDNNWSFPYLAEGMTPSGDEPLPAANFRIVTPGYFETLEIPLRRGRFLGSEDREDGTPAILVNEAFAESVWPGEDPLGKEVRIFGSQGHRVVGVVGDVRQHALDLAPRPEMYVSYRQWSAGSFYFMLRADGDPGALSGSVRRALRELDPGVPIPMITPLTAVVGDSVARARFYALLLGGFGGLALILGAVGVYGVTAHQVAGRRREFGVRLALGADPRGVVRRTVARGLVPVGSGVAVGLAAALGASRLLESLLYRVSPGDPATYAGVAVFLGAVGLLATWLPARRASRVDPVRVLTAE